MQTAKTPTVCPPSPGVTTSIQEFLASKLGVQEYGIGKLQMGPAQNAVSGIVDPCMPVLVNIARPMSGSKLGLIDTALH